MIDTTILNIKEIPSIFPSMTFSDRKITEIRMRKLPDAQKEIFETADKWKTVNRPNISNNIRIQSIFRNKYELQFRFKENTNIDIIRIAGTCQVVLYDGTILDLHVLSIDYEKISETCSYQATITFFILEEDYSSISSYLIKDNIRQICSDTDLQKIVFFSNKTISSEFTLLNNTYTIYSLLIPRYYSSEIKEKNTVQSGIEYISNSIDFKIMYYLCYLTEEESLIVRRYLPRCKAIFNPINGIGTATTSGNNQIVTTTNENSLIAGQFIRIGNELSEIDNVISSKNYMMKLPFENSYTNSSFSYSSIAASERIIPKLETKEMVDLYECKIEMKYSIIDFDNYS